LLEEGVIQLVDDHEDQVYDDEDHDAVDPGEEYCELPRSNLVLI
jgi:hypothetical protein